MIPQVAPEFRGAAEENLRGQELRSQLKINSAEQEHASLVTSSHAASTKAHTDYSAALKREQEQLAHNNRAETANSMFMISMQVAAAAAAVKGFVVNN